MNLSIVIPTFNRAEKLSIALKSLGTQLSQSPNLDNIDIIISDNGSTDNTSEIVTSWMDDYPDIKARRLINENNLGYDKNVYLALKSATSDFSWLLSDDDVLLDGAIDFVFDRLLKNKNIIFCFVNYKIESNGALNDSPCSIKTTILIEGDELPIMTAFSFSLCSSCIFRNSELKKFNTEKYIGTNWYHMFALRDILPTGKSLLIGEPQLLMSGASASIRESRLEKRLNEPNSHDYYLIAHLNFVKFAYSLENFGFSSKTAVLARNIAWKSNLRQIFYYKYSLPKYNIDELLFYVRSMGKYFSKKYFFWLLHVPIIFLPSILCVPLYLGLSKAKGISKRFA